MEFYDWGGCADWCGSPKMGTGTVGKVFPEVWGLLWLGASPPFPLTAYSLNASRIHCRIIQLFYRRSTGLSWGRFPGKGAGDAA